MAAMTKRYERPDRPDRPEDFDIPSLVPERDELVSRGRPRGNSVPEPEVHEGSAGTSGGVIFMLTLLFFGMLAMGGAAYLFYQEGQQALASLNDARTRIVALESTLSAVGQDTEQTTLGLLQRIETNFSEIDKLWAARNTLRGEIATIKNTTDNHAGLLSSLETAVTSHAGTINENSAALGTIRSRVDNIASNMSALENAGRQLESMNAELDALQKELETLRTSITPRLAATEQDIESINVYRLQLNQTITAMQNSIRQLQERLGQ